MTWVGSSKFNMWLMWKGWKADTLSQAFHWSKSRNYELSVVYNYIEWWRKQFCGKNKLHKWQKMWQEFFHWNINDILPFSHVCEFYPCPVEKRKVQIIYDQHLKFLHLNRCYWFLKFNLIQTINERNQILISKSIT